MDRSSEISSCLVGEERRLSSYYLLEILEISLTQIFRSFPPILNERLVRVRCKGCEESQVKIDATERKGERDREKEKERERERELCVGTAGDRAWKINFQGFPGRRPVHGDLGKASSVPRDALFFIFQYPDPSNCHNLRTSTYNRRRGLMTSSQEFRSPVAFPKISPPPLPCKKREKRKKKCSRHQRRKTSSSVYFPRTFRGCIKKSFDETFQLQVIPAN